MPESRQPFPRSYRVTRPADYRRIFAAGQRLHERYWTMVVAPSTTTLPRLGLAVSRRVAKRAVDRNRIKRTAREAFRHVCPQLPVAEYVLTCRSGADDATAAELKASLDKLWNRVIEKCATSC